MRSRLSVALLVINDAVDAASTNRLAISRSLTFVSCDRHARVRKGPVRVHTVGQHQDADRLVDDGAAASFICNGSLILRCSG
jgi:hypothetical protein